MVKASRIKEITPAGYSPEKAGVGGSIPSLATIEQVERFRFAGNVTRQPFNSPSFFNLVDSNALRNEDHSLTVLGRKISSGKQIKISCGTMRRGGPNMKQHRALENILVQIVGLAETIEESFESVSGKQPRSASMATSSPILFRYLKQSATVFAT